MYAYHRSLPTQSVYCPIAAGRACNILHPSNCPVSWSDDDDYDSTSEKQTGRYVWLLKRQGRKQVVFAAIVIWLLVQNFKKGGKSQVVFCGECCSYCYEPEWQQNPDAGYNVLYHNMRSSSVVYNDETSARDIHNHRLRRLRNSFGFLFAPKNYHSCFMPQSTLYTEGQAKNFLLLFLFKSFTNFNRQHFVLLPYKYQVVSAWANNPLHGMKSFKFITSVFFSWNCFAF